MAASYSNAYNQLQAKLIRARKNESLAAHHRELIEELQAQRDAEIARRAQFRTALKAAAKGLVDKQRLLWTQRRAKTGEDIQDAPPQEEVETPDDELAYLNGEIKRLTGEVFLLGDVQAARTRAQSEVEAYVHANLPKMSSQLAAFNQVEVSLRKDLRELDEAVDAGDTARRELEVLRDRLGAAEREAQDSSSGFHMADALGARGSINQRLILAAREQTRVVSHALQRFDFELGHTPAGTGGFDREYARNTERLAVSFWTSGKLLRQIRKSLTQTHETQVRITKAVELLRSDSHGVHTELEAVRAERLELLSKPQDAA